MQEITALKHRRHPGIVPLLASFTKHKTESGYESKCISMIFPYAEMDMEVWLNLSAPPAHLACLSRTDQRGCLYRMMGQLLESLAYLHSEIDRQVMCHYDLKPRNILVIGKSLVIADLGFSQLVSLSKGRGSGVDGGERLGTTTYRPPEYYKEDSWERREGQTFGRAFDIWAMGCIMIQVAVLIVWGWESGKVGEFWKARREFLPPVKAGLGATQGSSGDDSFVKSIPVVDTWLSLLQKEDGSVMLKEYLAIAIQMLRQDPSDRTSAWEAALDLHELLHPDATESVRFQKTAALVQKPTVPYKTGNFETPLHRAAARGNLVRVIELAEAGWSAEQRDKLGRTPIEWAELQGHPQLNEVMCRAKKIHQSGRKHALLDLPHEHALQLQEKRGFGLSKMIARKFPA
jgi:serine/threonine protein kinase